VKKRKGKGKREKEEEKRKREEKREKGTYKGENKRKFVLFPPVFGSHRKQRKTFFLESNIFPSQ